MVDHRRATFGTRVIFSSSLSPRQEEVKSVKRVAVIKPPRLLCTTTTVLYQLLCVSACVMELLTSFPYGSALSSTAAVFLGRRRTSDSIEVNDLEHVQLTTRTMFYDAAMSRLLRKRPLAEAAHSLIEICIRMWEETGIFSSILVLRPILIVLTF